MSDTSVPSHNAITPVEPFVVAGRSIVPEEMCAYKVTQILALITKVSEEIKLSEILAPLIEAIRSNDPTASMQVGLSIVPRLFAVAPDALVRAVATAIIPNSELEALFRQGQGKIAAKVDDEMIFLYTHASAQNICDLASAFIPLLGLDALKNALTRLALSVTTSLGIKPNPTV